MADPVFKTAQERADWEREQRGLKSNYGLFRSANRDPSTFRQPSWAGKPIETPELQPGQQNLAQTPQQPYSWLINPDQQVSVGDPKAQAIIDQASAGPDVGEVGQQALQKFEQETLPVTQDTMFAPTGTDIGRGVYRDGNSFTNIRSDGKPTAESQNSHYAKPDWVKDDTPKDAFGNWMRPETVAYVKQRDAFRAAGLPMYEGARFGVGGQMVSGPRSLAPQAPIQTPQSDANAQMAQNTALQQANSLRAVPQRTQISQNWANQQLASSGAMSVMPKTRRGPQRLRDLPEAPDEITQSLKPLV